MVRIQQVGYRDIPKIYNIELRSYEYPLEAAGLQQILEIGGALPFIGTISGLGATWALGQYHREDAEVEIKRLATHPEYRMQGFARMIVGKIWDEAVKRQAKKLYFMVPEYQTLNDDPDSVADFMWKMNFKATGIERDYFYRYGRDYDAIRFERAT